MATSNHVIRLKPFSYIHVLDNNANITKVVTGPKTFTRQEHEQVVEGPTKMLMIPPRHYCVIANPILRDEEGRPLTDNFGNIRLKHGDEEIRGEQEPFPLYPGESLVGKISPLQVVAANAALRLRCIRDFTDKTDVARKAGDEWLFKGPGTYYPAVEVQVVEIIKSTIVKENQALRLRARRKMIDSNKVERQAGEEWLIKTAGAYLPEVDEEVVDTVRAHVLTDKKALHLRSKRTFKDCSGVERKAGQEWLVTINDAETHIPDVYEEVVGEVRITTLNNRQYAVILDPVGEDGNNKLGKKELVKGEKSFFLRPGERLESGIQNVHVLDGEEALLLRAKETFSDVAEKTERKPGDKWMIKGPCDYIPSIEVEILEKRRVIPLDENEGIYVRDLNTGKVRSVIGEAYLLKSNEELWEKELPEGVEELLQQREYSGSAGKGRIEAREKTRVVTYRAPHNSAVQVYDYTTNQSRVQYGPDLVMLAPDEHFTLISLSGGKPKRQDVIKSICVLLGPDFMTDIVTVETSDHARLSLQLAYNWHFDVDKNNANDESAVKIFSVPDFVGDACKSIASRVRGAVASTSFDDFHKQSAECIRSAVFGVDAEGNVKPNLKFPANNLVITGIDIQSVEPIDQRTRDSLQKSVQLAIEITTKSQEATARHDAQRKEQEARGKLERQKINDESEAEDARKSLLTLQAQSAAVESTGHAAAEAKARAEAAKIEGEAAVKQAQLRSEASSIKSQAELEQAKKRQEADLAHKAKLCDLELSKARKLAEIEAKKFAEIVDAIGSETIQQIARAGPEMQAKLLGGLGLKGIMITDGNSPINMFNTAKGLIGEGMSTE